MARVQLLVVTLWVGSLWTIGCMVAPMLFRILPDRVLAGTIAGNLFHVEAWLSVGCAVALLLFRLKRQDGRTQKALPILVISMLVCTLLGYFALHPFMSVLREAAGSAGVMDLDARVQFGILHGISSVFYLIQSLLGIALVLKWR